ncbi:MAG TPA: dihydroxyacetone kinase subunit DhaL [Pseudonocardiaceae bacterium]|nr:dihydroxyacetone kinase subunit DhaL [Pseudonocardiaceae bacterium]
MTATTTTAGWLRAYTREVLARQQELTSLDQRLGDGDFGANLAGGMRLVDGELGQLPENAAPDEALSVAATVFLDKVGGTSGPLFGLLFNELAAAVRKSGKWDAAALAEGTRGGLAAIQRVGEAEPGDKTLVDALDPAVTALAQNTGADLPTAFAAAAAAARSGAESTAAGRARRGRASYVGAHAEGVPDPGAVAVALLFTVG